MATQTKTFLFVGAGLEDPDLVFQLQEAVSEHGDAVGPHYARLPHHEAPEIRREILRNSLHIEVIPIGTEEEALSEDKSWLTARTAEALCDLSGRVARKRIERAMPGVPTSDNVSFCLMASLRLRVSQT
jgi:hypothetical protein